MSSIEAHHHSVVKIGGISKNRGKAQQVQQTPHSQHSESAFLTEIFSSKPKMSSSPVYGNFTSILPTSAVVFHAALNVFLSITAVLGNALILTALRKVSSVHPPTKLLFQCLAVTDLCVGLITQPLFVMLLLTVVPKVYLYVALNATGLVLCGVSILTSTAISVDRLLALLLGIRYRHVVTLRRVCIVIFCLWLTGVSAALLYIFLGDFIGRSAALVLVLTSVVTSVISYTKIFLKLRNKQAQVTERHARKGQTNEGGIPLNIARYKKTVSSIACVQLALVVCYLPYIISCIIGPINGWRDGARIAWCFSATLVYLNSSLNPILYCWKIKEVRQVVKDTLKQFCCLTSC